MSQTFGTQTVPYIGSLLPRPIALCAPPTPGARPTSVIVEIPWNLPAYVGGSVAVTLAAQGPNNSLDRIISCLIDNTGNPATVVVVFTDTNDTLVAPPFAVVRRSVDTNNLQFNTFCENPSSARLAAAATRIIVSNVPHDASISAERTFAIAQWYASSQAFGTDVFGTPALGDQVTQLSIDLSINDNQIMLPVQPGGFYIITNYEFNLLGAYNTFGARLWSATLRSGTLLNILTMNAAISSDMSVYRANPCVLRADRTNMILPANTFYSLVNSQLIAAGTLVGTMQYTWIAT